MRAQAFRSVMKATTLIPAPQRAQRRISISKTRFSSVPQSSLEARRIDEAFVVGLFPVQALERKEAPASPRLSPMDAGARLGRTRTISIRGFLASRFRWARSSSLAHCAVSRAQDKDGTGAPCVVDDVQASHLLLIRSFRGGSGAR
jgi:hypothetical protein